MHENPAEDAFGLRMAQAPDGGRQWWPVGDAMNPQNDSPAAATHSIGAAAQPSPLWRTLYPGFRSEQVRTTGAEINLVTGGAGPPC